MNKRNLRFLENDLKQSIINDIKSVAQYHSRRYKGIDAGFFSVPRQVFCYVDYLGFIAFGKNNTKGAEEFIKTFFPPTYRPYSELLYSMWRHGTIHEYGPKSYYFDTPTKPQKRIRIGWLANNNNSKAHRQENLKFYSMRGTNKVYLVLNICQLVDDLLFALDELMNRMKSDKRYRSQCEQRLNEKSDFFHYESISGKERPNIVKKQIESAWGNRSGEINKEGKVINRFK